MGDETIDISMFGMVTIEVTYPEGLFEDQEELGYLSINASFLNYQYKY